MATQLPPYFLHWGYIVRVCLTALGALIGDRLCICRDLRGCRPGTAHTASFKYPGFDAMLQNIFPPWNLPPLCCDGSLPQGGGGDAPQNCSTNCSSACKTPVAEDGMMT